MKLLKSIGLLTMAAVSYAGQINFRVICIECNTVAVRINGADTPLQKYDTLPYYMGTAEASTGTKYHYVSDIGEEPFEREFKGELKDRTYNDFFNREVTVKEMFQFGFPESKKWSHSIGKQELFDDSYIPTIVIDGGLNFFQTAPKNTVTVPRMTFFLKDSVHYFTQVPLSCKNRNEDKFQVRFGLQNNSEGKNPLKRNILKLRASSEDPAFMRQLIYSDILHAIGNPTHESVTCRVYSDGVGIGVYVLQEDVSTKSFVRSAFHGNEKTGKINVKELGSPLDCSTGADFQLDDNYSAFQPLAGEDNKKIVGLIQAMNNVDPNNESAIKEFSEKWFDLDVFLKALAVEYLAGHWDSYWYYTTNFVMYDYPDESTSSTTKYYFVDQDFDLTWGCGLSDTINRYGNDFPKQSYKNDVNRTWNIGSEDGPHRYAVDKFLTGSVTKDMFEKYLIAIVKHIFNPVAMRAKVEAYKERIRPELVWEYSIPKQYNSLNSKKYSFNIEDFDTGIEKGGRRHAWGIMDWTQMRADAVAQEFQFQYDSVPLTQQQVDGTGDQATSDGYNFRVISKSIILIAIIYILL